MFDDSGGGRPALQFVMPESGKSYQVIFDPAGGTIKFYDDSAKAYVATFRKS
ncbi:MAG: hypothetical protein HFJ75_10535 [Eggerthellaceae bacterium]|nr:hypothetical protein [Eggerthellaceae bacterium]